VKCTHMQSSMYNMSLANKYSLYIVNNPMTMGHNNFLQQMLICVMRINMVHVTFQPMLNYCLKFNVGDLVYFVVFFCHVTNIQCLRSEVLTKTHGTTLGLGPTLIPP
jgi:hypothetical protein